MQFLRIIFSKTIIVDDLHNNILSGNYKMNIGECMMRKIDMHKCLMLNNEVEFVRGEDIINAHNLHNINNAREDVHNLHNINNAREDVHNLHNINNAREDVHNLHNNNKENVHNLHNNNDKEQMHNLTDNTEEQMHNLTDNTEEQMHNLTDNADNTEEPVHNTESTKHKKLKLKRKNTNLLKSKKKNEDSSSSSDKATILRHEDLKIKQKQKIIDYEILNKKIKEYTNSIGNLENNLATTVGELKEKRAEERIYDNKIMDLNKFININNLKRDRLKNEILMLNDLIGKYRGKIDGINEALGKYKKEKHALSHDINAIDNEMCKLNDE